MKIYRVYYWSGTDSSHGYGFFWEKEMAEKVAEEFDSRDPGNNDCDVDCIQFDMTKEGILSLLAQTAMHANNG